MTDAYEAERENGSPSVLDDEACFLKLKRWFKASKEHSSQWREEADEDYRFAAGQQWTDQEKQALRDQMRPVITFNRIGSVLDSVSGTEVSNRQEVKYYPRTDGDVQVNEVLTAGAKWFRDQCDAEDEESDAFMDVLICGMGWTETRLDYEIDEEGAPVIDRIDPFEMFWDSTAKKRNLDDARHVFRVREISTDDAIALIPGVDEDDLDAAWARQDTGQGKSDESREEARFYRPDGGQGEGQIEGRETVTLVECQWWERESVHLFPDPATGQIAELDDESFKVFSKRIGELGMEKPKSVTMSRRKYYRAYLGKSLLLKEESPFQGHFSFKCITGKREGVKGTYFGLVRQMKDPQKWANKWLSQTLHIMNANAKSGVMVEDGVAEDMNEFEQNWARPDAVTRLAKGALTGPNGAKIQPKPVAQFPAGFFQMTQYAVQSIRDASGVNMELLGLVDREQAGVLEAQRKKAAMAILATLFDSLRRYRKSQGRLLMQIITRFLSDGRLIRIAGEEGAKYVPLLKAQDVEKFDVIVDDAPTSPHQKEMTWLMLQQMLPMVKDQMTPDMWALVLDASPLPSAVNEKFKAAISAGRDQQAQEAEKQKQIAEAGAVAEVEKTQSETALNMARAAGEGMPDAGGEHAPMPQDAQEEAALLAMEREVKALKLQVEALAAKKKMMDVLVPEQVDGPDPIEIEARQLDNEQKRIQIDLARHR